MKRITYLLGAGASCKSQPLISNMKERMHLLLQMLSSSNICHKLIDNELQKKTNNLYAKYKNVVCESFNHYTPDTFAKKLWLNNDYKTLKIFKEFLNLYFIFEQHFILSTRAKMDLVSGSMDIGIYNMVLKIGGSNSFMNDVSGLNKEQYVKDKSIFFKNLTTNIDYRYDVFYATLLQKANYNSGFGLVLPDQINIITWNYDNQFELAYKPYAKGMLYDDIRSQLNINPTSFDSDKSHIIKLNGECNIADPENIDSGIITFSKALSNLLDNKAPENFIKFAWEKDVKQTKLQSVAHDILENSDELIIIGYSFPNFNREIDNINIKKFPIKYFSLSDKSKITIQVPDIKEFEKIKDRSTAFMDTSMINLDNFPFVHIEDTDQFYIPMI